MAAKKQKKKYVPKPIYYPKLVIAIHSFLPFEEEVSRILKEGTLVLDEEGTPIYHDSYKKPLSVASGIFTYARMAEIYAVRKKTTFETKAMWDFLKAVNREIEMSEELIEEATRAFEACKKVFVSIPPVESRDIMNTIRIELVGAGILKEKVDYGFT